MTRIEPGWYKSEDGRVDIRKENRVSAGGIGFWDVRVDGKLIGFGETKAEAIKLAQLHLAKLKGCP